MRLTVRRPGTRQFLDFSIVRETLTETSVHDAMLVHSKLASIYKIGYARVSQFTQATAKDLSAALDDLEQHGRQAFVLDLGLLLFFLVYTFVFNWTFDRIFGLPASALPTGGKG